MALNVTETLKRLVSTASVNPMGGESSGPEFYETRLTEHLRGLFDRLGLAHRRQQIEPSRANILARLDGDVPPDRGGGLILFDAHQDTVPVTGMTIEPFTPLVREGRLYGRGSCDTKGSMAAMLTAISRLADERPAGMPTIVLSCTVNEEYGFSGAIALSQAWAEGSASELSAILPRKPDAAIIGEPTSLRIVVAHKGGVRWQMHTRGRAAHGSTPE